MLAARLTRAVRPLAVPVASRHFAACPLESAQKLYDDVVAKSVKEFEANKDKIAGDLDAELAANKMVLFMEGTPDAPKSELSMNVVKMLTQAQVVPLLSVDVLAHPAILGYTVSKTAKNRAPHLYVNGSFYGDHDSLLAKYNAGELSQLGTQATKSSGSGFGGELPIANY